MAVSTIQAQYQSQASSSGGHGASNENKRLRDTWKPQDKKGKGTGKYQKGDKGKSKGKGNKFVNAKTPDNRQICFRYNTKGDFCPGCDRAHVCTTCFAAKPVHKCNHQKTGDKKPQQ